MKITYSHTASSVTYLLNDQGVEWVANVYPSGTGTYPLIKCASRIYNHHSTDDFTLLLKLASKFKVNLDITNQQSINMAHRKFVEAVHYPTADSDWYTFNEGLHAAENVLQGRGPMTTIDQNIVKNTYTRLFDIPPTWRADSLNTDGLFAGFTLIGRWWDEIWRANDWDCPLSHYKSQQFVNSQVVMRFQPSSLPPSDCQEAAERFKATHVGSKCKWEYAQHGLYKLGTLDSSVNFDQWRSQPVTTVTIH